MNMMTRAPKLRPTDRPKDRQGQGRPGLPSLLPTVSDPFYFVQPNASSVIQTEEPTAAGVNMPSQMPSAFVNEEPAPIQSPQTARTLVPTTTNRGISNNGTNTATNTTADDSTLAVNQPIPSSRVIRAAGTVLLLGTIAIYLLLILLARRRRKRLDTDKPRRAKKSKASPTTPRGAADLEASFTQTTISTNNSPDRSSPDQDSPSNHSMDQSPPFNAPASRDIETAATYVNVVDSNQDARQSIERGDGISVMPPAARPRKASHSKDETPKGTAKPTPKRKVARKIAGADTVVDSPLPRDNLFNDDRIVSTKDGTPEVVGSNAAVANAPKPRRAPLGDKPDKSTTKRLKQAKRPSSSTGATSQRPISSTLKTVRSTQPIDTESTSPRASSAKTPHVRGTGKVKAAIRANEARIAGTIDSP